MKDPTSFDNLVEEILADPDTRAGFLFAGVLRNIATQIKTAAEQQQIGADALSERAVIPITDAKTLLREDYFFNISLMSIIKAVDLLGIKLNITIDPMTRRGGSHENRL